MAPRDYRSVLRVGEAGASPRRVVDEHLEDASDGEPVDEALVACVQLRDAAPSRLPWMNLLARVFRVDIPGCSRCSGSMRVTRAVTTPENIPAEFRGARPPPASPAAP